MMQSQKIEQDSYGVPANRTCVHVKDICQVKQTLAMFPYFVSYE